MSPLGRLRARASASAERAIGCLVLATYAAVLVAAVVAVAAALVRAGPGGRPRALALAMLVLLLPLWPGAFRSVAWLPLLVSTIVAAGAVAATRTGDVGMATAAGLFHAVTMGGAAAYLGLLSLFARNAREWQRVTFRVLLPMALSALAGVLLALSGAWSGVVALLRG